ncbi:LPXTG cell wall anchor domain-containing protein [Candidatus Saccharibacteria bacterium]|jgi:LPXTG-motif cell wall-anchored protein|nr:LPXTG cell wall anchor domain-containing protein [Candidatus Saccharibacteria bacterium]HOR23432.1 LPXTG cell wall anchor domain-containing protein [Candidatus Saccharibacteria bacterium]HPW47860.1 LPXTG cell wall anchor domain-containing protein [Candidatus Saccharibacteria bacterium]
MSEFTIAFLIAAGGGTWVYLYFMRKTGSNTQNSLIAAGLVGVLIFIAAFIVLGFINKKM